MADNLIDLRRRIVSVKNTQKITKAMKTVSAAKLRKSVLEVNRARPVLKKIAHILDLLLTTGLKKSDPLIMKVDSRERVIVLFTSDKGLCGAFNTHLIKELEKMISESNEDEKISIVTIGKKGYVYCSKKGYRILKDFPDFGKNTSYNDISEISGYLAELYSSGIYKRVDFLYTDFENASRQEIKYTGFLPVTIEHADEAETLPEYIFEPGPEDIFENLLPRYISLKLFLTLLSSQASEHAARMIAMELATQNAIDMIKSLTLTMNKLRQASITKELLEIITATEALAK